MSPISQLLDGTRIQAHCPPCSLKASIILRHIKPYRDIDEFPGAGLSYGSVALHLALVASGYACHYIYDLAGAAKLLENAGAELRYLDGTRPAWGDLIANPDQKSPDFFLGSPGGRLSGWRGM